MRLEREFDLRYPEFLHPAEGTPPADEKHISFWLHEGKRFLNPARWGVLYRAAVCAWAACRLAASQRRAQDGVLGGSSGPVASASVGGESVSFAVAASSADTATDAWYRLYPPYGHDYLLLRDMCMSGVCPA